MTTWKTKMQKFWNNTVQGCKDIKTVLEEGNFKLFLKQIVFVVLLIMGFRYVSGMITQKNENVLGQISAVQAQKENEKEYVANKKKLLDLEPRFPDISTKND